MVTLVYLQGIKPHCEAVVQSCGMCECTGLVCWMCAECSACVMCWRDESGYSM